MRQYLYLTNLITSCLITSCLGTHDSITNFRDALYFCKKIAYANVYRSHTYPSDSVEIYDATDDVMRILKKEEFDVNTFDDKGNSILYYALTSNNPNLVFSLKVIGANFNNVNSRGESAFDIVNQPRVDEYGNPAFETMQEICRIVVDSPSESISSPDLDLISRLVSTSRHRSVLLRFWPYQNFNDIDQAVRKLRQ